MKKILIYVLFSLSLFSAGIWKTVEMTDWDLTDGGRAMIQIKGEDKFLKVSPDGVGGLTYTILYDEKLYHDGRQRTEISISNDKGVVFDLPATVILSEGPGLEWVDEKIMEFSGQAASLINKVMREGNTITFYYKVPFTDWEQEYRYQHKIKKITFSSKDYTKSRDSMLRRKDTKEVYKIAPYYEEKANEFAKILLEDIRDRISKVGQNYYDYDQGVYNQYYKNLKKGK